MLKSPYLILILFGLVTVSYLGMCVPKIIANIFNCLENPLLHSEMKTHLISLFLVVLGEYTIRVLFQTFLLYYLKNVIEYVRNECFKRWVHHIDKSGQGEELPLGELLSRMMNDTNALNELVSFGTFGVIIDAFFIISCFISFYQLESFSSTSIMLLECVIVISLLWGSKLMSKVFYQVRVSNGICARVVADLVGGFTDLYYTKKNNYSKLKGEKVFENFLQDQMKANFWDATYYSFAESLFPIMLVVLVFLIPQSPIRNVAMIAVLIDVIQRSMNPLKSMTSKISTFQRAYTGLGRIEDFFKKLDPHYLQNNQEILESSITQIKVKIPSFTYTQKQTGFSLHSISINIQKGKGMFACVGLSGSGKTTLMNILSLNLNPSNFSFIIKLENPKGNNIELNVDAHSTIQMQQYRELVALVTQESPLFSDTLEFNITLGMNRNLFNEFWNRMCSEIPYLVHWGIQPNKVVDLTKISFGQRQLIAGIRALFFKKKIILLDEIASGLDSQLAKAIIDLMEKLKEHSFIFIVAHRLETIKMSDCIFVMEKGTITHSGDHQTLLKTSTTYQQLQLV